ncbi:hypothetical protein [Chryseolinea sp. H1M3-3]|uniref:hypothetical protein n=1 Tax=Chryseolinea sp. H1M3-3 TaxID=3034144 RepID=UPI0023EAD12C|nr:hypothetical protein [Chryseolinea sp. H1M3-3]
MKRNLWLVLVVGMYAQLGAQTHTEKINKEFAFEKRGSHNALMIANINGNIKVEAYPGDKIQVEITKRIQGKTNERLEKGKTEIQLGVIDLADTIILYVSSPCNHFEKSNAREGRTQRSTTWRYSWEQHGRSCHESYDYAMDFLVKVPSSLNVLLSTINEGDIVVENVKGVVTAHNINGSIRLYNLMREAEASTINGDVDVEYAQNPQSDCRFYSLNGDINALFQKGLTASMSFESFNGSLYTNIDKLEHLPTQVEKKNNDKGIKYKVNNNRYKIGAGGAFLDFETFNGNVYVKEKTN